LRILNPRAFEPAQVIRAKADLFRTWPAADATRAHPESLTWKCGFR
jgi:hypothetical protein